MTNKFNISDRKCCVSTKQYLPKLQIKNNLYSNKKSDREIFIKINIINQKYYIKVKF